MNRNYPQLRDALLASLAELTFFFSFLFFQTRVRASALYYMGLPGPGFIIVSIAEERLQNMPLVVEDAKMTLCVTSWTFRSET